MKTKRSIIAAILLMAFSSVKAEGDYELVLSKLMAFANFETDHSPLVEEHMPGRFVQKLEEISRCEFSIVQDLNVTYVGFGGKAMHRVHEQTYHFHMKHMDPASMETWGYSSYVLKTYNNEMHVDSIYKEPNRFKESDKVDIVQFIHEKTTAKLFGKHLVALAELCNE